MVFLGQLFFSLVALSVFARYGATPCTSDGHIMGEACTDNEEGNLFLQMAKKGTRGAKDVEGEKMQLNESSEEDDEAEVAVKPFDCMKFPTPIQLLKDGKTGFAFKQLNVATGKYVKVFGIPYDRVFPKYKDMNACGINPADDTPYCVMWSTSGKHFVVKMDAQTLRIIAQIPKPSVGKAYTTGTFSPEGTYYISDSKANFYVMENLKKYPGLASERKPGMRKWLDMVQQKPKGFSSAHDAVIVNYDFTGSGTKKQYLIVLNMGNLMLAEMKDGKFQDTYIIPYQYAKKGKSMAKGKKTDKWGAGWSFSGKVFFAINTGEGVYEVELPKLDLSKYKKNAKNTKTFNLKMAGSSEPSGFNDGANCMNVADPWLTKVLPMNCQKHSAPMQVLRQPWMGYAVKKLDIPTGVYQDVFALPFSKTTPPYKFLNAIGVNPMDSVAYGCLTFNDFPSKFFIIRFDGAKIEFVIKVKAKLDPVAGTFDSQGNYYFVHNTEYSHNPEMFRITGLDKTPGFADKGAKSLKVMEASEFDGLENKLNLWNFFHFADIVAVNMPVESQKAKEYLVSINREKQAMFVEWDGTNASNSKILKFMTNDPFKPTKVYQNFGAAWMYGNRAFFSNNDGEGVVEIEQVDINKETIKLKKVGKSAPIYNNDGFNCWGFPDPWPVIKGPVGVPLTKPGPLTKPLLIPRLGK
mmetsp:Transcript_76553/g.132446  ORF Transcript_76553/g.132446 Transcript_76553/m.132446 type:complete len:690 (+) Transcript_76553:55-2124(+)